MTHVLEPLDANGARDAAEMRELVLLAKLAPRDEKQAQRALLTLARSWEWCEEVTFSVDDAEQGSVLLPSVLFARPFANAWGHIHRGFRTIHKGHDVEELEGWAFDAQTVNVDRVPGQVRKNVKRIDPDRPGRYIDHRLDEEELVAARHRMGAILVRRALLNVLPGKPVRRVMLQCEQTLDRHYAAVSKSEREAALESLLAAWSRFGITRADLERNLGHNLEWLSSAEEMRLRGLLRAVHQGAVSVPSIFGGGQVVVEPGARVCEDARGDGPTADAEPPPISPTVPPRVDVDASEAPY